jgi:hypothetical protein
MAIESPTYTVESKDGNIEIRKYVYKFMVFLILLTIKVLCILPGVVPMNSKKFVGHICI